MEELRKQYIDMRNKKVIDIDFLLRYAIHKGFSGSTEEFLLACNYLIPDVLIKALDLEFGITYVETTKGMFIKVVE